MRNSLLSTWVLFCLVMALQGNSARGEMKTWDGRHDIQRIEVTAVYFLPKDRQALVDWKERVQYFCRRIELFHARAYGEQSVLKVKLNPEPLRSARTTAQLRSGDANFIFYQTMRESAERLNFGAGEKSGFPILLVLSDINWRPLDDFWRTRPTEAGGWEFEGNYNRGKHHPGATSGGARATFLSQQGMGWGLVSADGWRVPYCGSDCVVYHEGVGHSIGMPHPEPQDDSVMSLAQYRGWLNQSWITPSQKERLGWEPPTKPVSTEADLFTKLTAVNEPVVPSPGQPVGLNFTWPASTQIKQLKVQIQTDLKGPWIDCSPQGNDKEPPERVELGSFDRPTPVSYKVQVSLADGQETELWGYFQVRTGINDTPIPPYSPEEGIALPTRMQANSIANGKAVEMLPLIDPEKNGVSGTWKKVEGALESPKAYGSRIELPGEAPAEYD